MASQAVLSHLAFIKPIASLPPAGPRMTGLPWFSTYPPSLGISGPNAKRFHKPFIHCAPPSATLTGGENWGFGATSGSNTLLSPIQSVRHSLLTAQVSSQEEECQGGETLTQSKQKHGPWLSAQAMVAGPTFLLFLGWEKVSAIPVSQTLEEGRCPDYVTFSRSLVRVPVKPFVLCREAA